MAWYGYLILSIVFLGIASSIGYLTYRKIKKMPSLDEECGISNGKSLVKLYKINKKKEAKSKNSNSHSGGCCCG